MPKSSCSVKDLESYINKKFLYHTMWQIKVDSLKELETELDTKYKQMLRWAEDIAEPVYIYGYFNEITAQVVTIGERAVEKAHQLKENGEYQDYFYWHGFCATLTEALAEYVHAKIRVELGLGATEGKRLSYGYEALPDILEQKKILDLLEAQEIGIEMTDSGMLEPEYSTCALVFIAFPLEIGTKLEITECGLLR
jgi:cobalamin-dependent methionine synthase I